MSIESGKKLGLIASLISVILPIVAIVGAMAFVISIIFTATTGIGSGTVVPVFGLSAGFTAFLVAVGAMGVIGFILFMVAMYRLSNYYNEQGIFKNVLYAFILNIVGGIVSVGVYFAVILSAIGSLPQTGTQTNLAPFFTQFIISYLALIGVAFVFQIVNGLLYMRAFNMLSEKSGVDNFKTAGLLFLIGAIIPVVAWIAWIFATIGFRNPKPASAVSPPVPCFTQPPPLVTAQTKRCPNCGRKNRPGSLYCSYCGNPLQ